MNLSSDIYEISIKKKDNLLRSFEKPEYDLIYNTHGKKTETQTKNHKKIVKIIIKLQDNAGVTRYNEKYN